MRAIPPAATTRSVTVAWRRWYRDVGDNDGHFWGHVQAIKRPTLLEICGPLIMSYPVSNNLQYRLSELNGGTLINFHHTALGLIREGDRHVSSGWSHNHARLKERVEAQLETPSSQFDCGTAASLAFICACSTCGAGESATVS